MPNIAPTDLRFRGVSTTTRARILRVSISVVVVSLVFGAPPLQASGVVNCELRSFLTEQANGAPQWNSATTRLRLDAAGHAYVDIRLRDADTDTVAALHSLLGEAEINTRYGLASGYLSPEDVDAIATLPGVLSVQAPFPVRARETPPSPKSPSNQIPTNSTESGSVMTEGDAIHRSNLPRARGVTGAGVKVGLLSTGIASWTASRDLGDLPTTIEYTSEGSHTKGIPVLEIVHDIAPNASLAFAPVETIQDFVDGIDYLVNTVNCDIVFDNIGFYGEPYFDDGPVAQSVADILDKVVYISSAGDDAQLHYQALYTDIDPTTSVGTLNRHDFGGGDTSLDITLPSGATLEATLGWSDPYGASGNDYDLYLFDNSLTKLLKYSNALQDGNDTAYEGLFYTNGLATPVTLKIVIDRTNGDARTLELFLYRISSMEYQTPSDCVFAQAAVPGVISVGAIHASDPGHDTASPNSSPGPSTMHDGVVRQTPRLMGIDGVSITGVGGHPSPYYSTGPSAAHVAGIAALIMEAEPHLSLQHVRDRLEWACVDLGPAGYDNTYGFGRLDAEIAVPPVIVPTRTLLDYLLGRQTLTPAQEAVVDVNSTGDADIGDVIWGIN